MLSGSSRSRELCKGAEQEPRVTQGRTVMALAKQSCSPAAPEEEQSRSGDGNKGRLNRPGIARQICSGEIGQSLSGTCPSQVSWSGSGLDKYLMARHGILGRDQVQGQWFESSF